MLYCNSVIQFYMHIIYAYYAKIVLFPPLLLLKGQNCAFNLIQNLLREIIIDCRVPVIDVKHVRCPELQ